MDMSCDYDVAQQTISGALVSTTRTATRISTEDIQFHRSSNPTASHAVDERSARLLSLAEKLLLRSVSSQTAPRPRLRNVDAVDTNWRTIVDGVDSLLERADIALDEYAGYFRKRSDDSREQSPTPKKSRFLPREFRNQNIAKPQLLFEHSLFNHETEPFKPFLLTKPHAQVPLEVLLGSRSENGLVCHPSLLASTRHRVLTCRRYPHPYQPEIETYQYPSFVHTISPPIEPKPFNTTKATFVDDIAGVHAMLADLKQAKEIAIDLEHHDAHSYIGIVSLMQISTRDRDWVIDTLKPWRRELQILNEVLADPLILKVLHGAQMDAIWLQRDLGLYLVGLFDTYHASRALGYPGHGLAFLLKKFVDFDAQKQYQTADWRIRPLPTELFDYARSDTHFLLYIYDMMRNELIKSSNITNDKLQDVLENSKEYTLQRYEHPFYCNLPKRSSNGWFNMLYKTPVNFSNTQLAVFRRVHEWRDTVGREEDENPNHVLGNHSLQNIARAIPSDKTTLFAVAGNVSHIVRSRVDELLAVIDEAQSDPDAGEEVRIALDATLNMRLPLNATTGPTQKSTHVSSPYSNFPQQPARANVSSFWGPVLGLGILTEISPHQDLFGLTLRRDGDLTDTIGAPKQMKDCAEGASRVSLAMEGAASDSAQLSDRPTMQSILKSKDGRDTMLDIKRKAERKIIENHSKPSTRISAAEDDVDGEAFDYDGEAPILLDSHRGSRREKKSQKTAFNPYAKAAEAPSGLGRAQNFRAGRTTTFK